MNSFKFGHISNPWTKSYYFMTEKALRKIICSRSWGTLCVQIQSQTHEFCIFRKRLNNLLIDEQLIFSFFKDKNKYDFH